MKFYPPKISDKISRAKNIGQSRDANAVGTGASFECGTFVKFSLKIEIETKQIIEAKYKTSGCGFTIAAAETLSEFIVGKKLNELHGFDASVLQAEIEHELGTFPANRAHCLEICIDALASAFKDFRRAQTEEFAGEQALICSCFGVSEPTIENLIASEYLSTVEEVTDRCGAGGGCGSCQPLIQEILDVFLRGDI